MEKEWGFKKSLTMRHRNYTKQDLKWAKLYQTDQTTSFSALENVNDGLSLGLKSNHHVYPCGAHLLQPGGFTTYYYCSEWRWYMYTWSERYNDRGLTSWISWLSISMISAKLGLWAGSCCQHFSRSSVSFGCVCFGIFGRSPCKIITSHCVKGLSTKHEKITIKSYRHDTFWTTPTAACSGVK